MAACRAAAALAEEEQGLPPGLLLAIGQQESGRWDTEWGKVSPWPFSTNAAGDSRFFATQSAAIDHVAVQQRAGVRSIDVGCFQINLWHHQNAFSTLQEAFDPVANARYAARFLVSLHAATGTWEGAVGRYHSATTSLAEPYTAAVFRFWHQPRNAMFSTPSRVEPWHREVAGVIVQYPGFSIGSGISPLPATNLPRVITPMSSNSRSVPGGAPGRL